MKITTLLLLLTLPLGACSTVKKCAEPANASTLECVAVNNVVDCTKGELPSIEAQFTPLVEKVITGATGADGAIDWSQVETAISSLGVADGVCILGNVIQDFTAHPPIVHRPPTPPTPPLPPLVGAAKPTSIRDEITKLWHLDPKTKIHFAGGDL